MRLVKQGKIEVLARQRTPHRDMTRLRAALHKLDDGEAILVHGLEYHRVNSVCTALRTTTSSKFLIRSTASGTGIYVWKNLNEEE